MFEEKLRYGFFILKSNPELSIGIAIVLAVFCFIRPKECGKLVVFGLFLILAFYIMSLFLGAVDSGSREKGSMIYKSKPQLDE